MKRALSAFALFGLLAFAASETVDAGLFCRAKTVCCEPAPMPCCQPAPAPVCCPAPAAVCCPTPAPCSAVARPCRVKGMLKRMCRRPAPVCCDPAPVASPCYNAVPMYSAPVYSAPPVCSGSAPYGYGVATYGPHWF
ncbi:MAG: hypothetical protein ABJZ55_01450 [Fuerstiella sp.]